MSKVQPLRPATPPRTPERAKLAAAIARYAAAKADVERIEAAREEIFSEVKMRALPARDEAAAALADARSRDTERLAAAYLGETDAAVALGKLEKALVDAQAKIDEIEKTEIGLDARLKAAEEELTWSRSLRDQAHRDAIRNSPEMAAQVERYNALCREVAILSQIIAVDYAPDSFRRSSLANYSDLPTEEASAWRAAIEAMKFDPDAPLPAPRITEIRRTIVDPTAA